MGQCFSVSANCACQSPVDLVSFDQDRAIAVLFGPLQVCGAAPPRSVEVAAIEVTPGATGEHPREARPAQSFRDRKTSEYERSAPVIGTLRLRDKERFMYRCHDRSVIARGLSELDLPIRFLFRCGEIPQQPASPRQDEVPVPVRRGGRARSESRVGGSPR